MAVSSQVTSTPPIPTELLVAASHAAVSNEIGRWLVHDIRGPLQGVTLTLALLSEPGDAPLDDGLREALAAASGELSNLVDLADRLLRIPRLDAEPGPVVLGDILRVAEHLLARRRIRFDLVWPAAASVGELPPVAMDADQLLHVVLATVGLATLAAGAVAEGRISLAVADSGDSVDLTLSAAPPAAAGSAGPPSSDVRLAASRALLERAGGAFLVAPEGDGTEFTARLPTWRGARA